MGDDAEARREARKNWPIRKFRLGEEPSEDLSPSTTVEQRLAMVWPITMNCWAFAGREIPRYRRAEVPGRVLRPKR